MSTVKELAQQVEADVNAAGWDQPARFWEIHGSEDDPYFVLVPDATPAIVPGPGDIPDGILGIAVVVEAWRHLTYEEMVTHLPELMDRFRESVRAAYSTTDPDAILSEKWYTFCAGIAPSDMRPEARRETRALIAATKHGDFTVITRDRGCEPMTTDINSSNFLEVLLAVTQLLTFDEKPNA